LCCCQPCDRFRAATTQYQRACRACGARLLSQNGVLFLDDTVQCQKMRWRKNQRGKWKFYRLYVFEYSSEEIERGYGAMAFESDFLQQIQFVESDKLN